MSAPTNCMDCPHAVRERDPDPYDSFCDDDEAVLCTLLPNTTRSEHHARSLGPFAHRPVTTSCRPYNKRRECVRPSWCPLVMAVGGGA